jgi:exosortase E/protease (VPEID-CTERM system)
VPRLGSWLALLFLLVAEIVALTVRFDATPLAGRDDLPSRLVATAPDVLQIAIGIAAAVVALGARRIRSFGFPCDLRIGPQLWPWLPLHLVSFALVLSLSARVFEIESSPSIAVAVAWLGAAACAALSWAAAAVPPRHWPGLSWRGRGVLVGGVLIGFGAWVLGRLARAGWDSTAAPTFWATSRLLRIFYADLVADPDSQVVGTSSFRVMIAPACSGYEGVALVCAYLAVYLAVFRRGLRFPGALCLLPIGALAAWLLNVVRIATLVAIGDSVSPELALGGFHSQAGWLAFNVVALGLAFAAHRSRLFSKNPAAPGRALDPTAAHLVPLLSVLLAGMLFEAVSTKPDALYPLGVLVGAAALAYSWRSIDGLGRRPLTDGEAVGRGGAWWAASTGVVVFAVWIGLEIVTPAARRATDPRESLAGLPEWALAAWVAFRLLGSVVVIPVVEEIAFRGYLLRRIMSPEFRAVPPRHFSVTAILVSSVVFGLLHEQWLAGTLAGAAYALAYGRRGRIGDAILAHAVTNGLIGITAFATGKWQLWV